MCAGWMVSKALPQRSCHSVAHIRIFFLQQNVANYDMDFDSLSCVENCCKYFSAKWYFASRRMCSLNDVTCIFLLAWQKCVYRFLFCFSTLTLFRVYCTQTLILLSVCDKKMWTSFNRKQFNMFLFLYPFSYFCDCRDFLHLALMLSFAHSLLF